MDVRVTLQPGMDVYGADGDKIGSIQEAYESYIMVAKGFFFPKDYYIPIDSVQGVDEDNRVYLSVTKEDALNRGWDTVPESAGSTSFGADDLGYADTETSFVDTEMLADSRLQSDGASEVISPDYVAATDKAVTGSEATRVPFYEEDLTATKRTVDRGSVRIEKELVTEERTITVPVTEERVRITRVDSADAKSPVNTADAFRDGVIEVPVTGEEVDIEKSTRLAGEVLVEKEAVQTDKRVSGSVRREEVRIDDATIADEREDSSRDGKNPMA